MSGIQRGRANPDDEHTCALFMAARGDTEALGRLHAALSPAVRDYLKALDGSLNLQDRQDMLQEVFLRCWQEAASFRGDASAKTFIFAIAKTVLHEGQSLRAKLPMAYQSDFDQIAAANVPGGSTAAPAADQLELCRAIEQAKARLSEAQRQAVELKHLHSLPVKEIAKLAGCSCGQFRDRLYRARKRLRQLLRDLPLHVLL